MDCPRVCKFCLTVSGPNNMLNKKEGIKSLDFPRDMYLKQEAPKQRYVRDWIGVRQRNQEGHMIQEQRRRHHLATQAL
jgi:hypothetical protein